MSFEELLYFSLFSYLMGYTPLGSSSIMKFWIIVVYENDI